MTLILADYCYDHKWPMESDGTSYIYTQNDTFYIRALVTSDLIQFAKIKGFDRWANSCWAEIKFSDWWDYRVDYDAIFGLAAFVNAKGIEPEDFSSLDLADYRRQYKRSL